MSVDIERIRQAFPGRVIEYLTAVDSTMRAATGRPAGAVVIAGEQTAGHGRHGRPWHSEPGNGIYCSIVLKPGPVLPLALGLAAAEAIGAVTGLVCDLRWPNDIMLGGKKVAGILVEASAGTAVAGIGVNVYHTRFPDGLADEATSLWLHAGGPEGVSSWATEILIALVAAVDRFAELDTDAIVRLFTHASSYARGRRVRVAQPDGIVEGVTAGLDPSGFLVLRKDDGSDTLILAGGVRAAGS